VKKLRVSLDTSVVGGCLDPEFAVWSNALVADFEAEHSLPAVSELVAAEVEVAPANVRKKLDQLLDLGAELSRIDQEALDLAGEHSQHEILPPKFRNDLLHIAIATLLGGESGGRLQTPTDLLATRGVLI